MCGGSSRTKGERVEPRGTTQLSSFYVVEMLFAPSLCTAFPQSSLLLLTGTTRWSPTARSTNSKLLQQRSECNL